MLGIKTPYPTLETGLFVRGLSDATILKCWGKLPKDKTLIEKTPSHIFETARIKRLLGARIILVKRRTLDVLTSMMQKNSFWKDSPKNLDEAIMLYKRFNLPIRKIMPDYIIQYESLWSNPVEETQKLFEFLRLDTKNVKGIVNKTLHGKRLPEKLRGVFRKGSPCQGEDCLSDCQIKNINKLGLT
jgi:hypothetical protein